MEVRMDNRKSRQASGYSVGMRRLVAARRAAFTLIEMLVVVVIISILAGLIFRLTTMAGRNREKAKTIQVVEMLANAIEEFRAEYGKYPPVPLYGGIQPVMYEYAVKQDPLDSETPKPRKLGWSTPRADEAMGYNGDLSGFEYSATKGDGLLYTFGLASFLTIRYDGRADDGPPTVLESRDSSPWYTHNAQKGDQPRDVQATTKIEPYLNGITSHSLVARVWKNGKNTNYNQRVTFYDGWGRQLRYESKPPYDSYKLWSKGPDGVDKTSDDIIVGRESGH
jgi:prepilin-type N-terminal cleavage/methylation domain-containing protein